MHCKQNLQGLLTICRKAGRLAMGLEPAKNAIMGGTAAGIAVCIDAAPRSKKEAAYFAQQAGLDCVTLPFTKLEMGQCVGRAAGVLQLQAGHQAPDHRNRCRAVGCGVVIGSQAFRVGACRVYGEGVFQSEALPPLHYADLWS